ncbi:MAG: C40 family peptidase [Clostridiales Family XIII bacterium]|nr:C40 family peptidase [Clostridiales Family XIII bacterium]
MEEAQKHLGKPYVFGANGPDAFDCGSFVSRCLTKSSVKNTGRLGAQALYNLCTPVSRENLRPGDLVFLTGTYSCPNPVSHVAIYVGNGMVIHAGSPIRYTSIDTAFRQSHHYAYGRVNP